MKHLRLALSLAFFVPAFAWMGVCAWNGRWPGAIGGSVVGLFFGLVFGGAGGRWLDKVFPPPDDAGR